MKRLVLAGAGHAHLHVLRSLAGEPWPQAEVVLISPHPRQIYSGMVPGWIAGHYRLAQCVAPIAPLAAAARVRFIQDTVSGLDAGRRVVHTAESGSIPYDVLSLDTGAALATEALSRTGARMLPVRPLEAFVAGWEDVLHGVLRQGRVDVAVVGGGAAGVELALAVAHRLRGALGRDRCRVVLACGGGLLPGHGRGVVARVRRALALRGVEVMDARVTGCDAGVRTDGGVIIPVDCIVAATGVRPPDWVAGSGLATGADGFIAVGDGQRSLSHPGVFAAGDVADRVDAPHARSGVYAVRAGPPLTRNLHRALAGLAPVPYTPQRRSLYLLATGPKEAIVSWGGLSAGGRLAWRWKDWIDRRFMRRYQIAAEYIGEPSARD